MGEFCRASSLVEEEEEGEEAATKRQKELGESSATQVEASDSKQGQKSEPKRHGLDALGSRLSDLQQNILNRQESFNGSTNADT